MNRMYSLSKTNRTRSTLLVLGCLFVVGSNVTLAAFDPILAMSGHGSESGDPIWYRLLKYVGKLHVLVIHFPIAFLLGACLAQWWFMAKGTGERTALVMLWFGTLGAIAAASLGWAFAYDSAYFGDSEELLFWHRWLGTSTATVALLVLLFRKKLGKKGLAIGLTAATLLVGIAAHYGGSLVRGADYLLKF